MAFLYVGEEIGWLDEVKPLTMLNDSISCLPIKGAFARLLLQIRRSRVNLVTAGWKLSAKKQGYVPCECNLFHCAPVGLLSLPFPAPPFLPIRVSPTLANTAANIGVYKTWYGERISGPFRWSRYGRVDVERGYRVMGAWISQFLTQFVFPLRRPVLMKYGHIYVSTVVNMRIDRRLQWREHRLTRFHETDPLPVGISYPSWWLLFEKTECGARRSHGCSWMIYERPLAKVVQVS